MQSSDPFKLFIENANSLGYSQRDVTFLINFAWISFMGGLGSFLAYLIETRIMKRENKA